MEDPITHEKWPLFCNGWLNPEALKSAIENPLKRRDDAEVMICLLMIRPPSPMLPEEVAD